MRIKNKLAVLVAGGTGGHINSALALGEKFKKEGIDTLFFTGTRYLDYKLFKEERAIHLSSSPLKYISPLKILKSIYKNFKVFVKSWLILLREKPSFVMGTGGYICGPVCMAAFFLRIPVFILEQNSVLGFTNKLLSFISLKIFLHFERTKGFIKYFNKKIIISGNPIRSSFFQKNFEEQQDDSSSFNILVFGGSLGAKSLNDLVNGLVGSRVNFKIHIKHYTGRGESKTASLDNIIYEKYEYIENIVSFYNWCDLIVSRSGGSTVAELRIIKKPVVLIPYPHHNDKHQLFNALYLQEEVDFPVFVKDDIHELSQDRCSKLIQIIKEIKENKTCIRSKLDKFKTPYDQSTLTIYNQVSKYV